LTYAATETRDAQNDIQIYACLINSLTELGKSRVYVDSIRYTVNGQPNGLLLLKVIVQKSHIDTRATVTVIRTRLSSLDAKIADFSDDIVEFNKYVKTQRTNLEARGEKTLDLLVNLFKGYKSVADQAFVRYIETKEDEYNEGKDFSPEELMEIAETKYKTLLEVGHWKQPSSQDRKIVALTAQIKQLETANKQVAKDWKKSDAAASTSKKSDGKGGNGSNDKWYLTAPGPKDPRTKTVNNEVHHWCKNHGDRKCNYNS